MHSLLRVLVCLLCVMLSSAVEMQAQVSQPTPGVPSSRTLTINGTTNEIACTGGTQSLAANRTWTCALAATVDLSDQTVTMPVKAGATPPATCTADKELFIDTDTSPGATLLVCNPTGNGWLLVNPAGLPDPGTNGIVVRNSATPTTVNRSVAATSPVTVSNGDGVSGNPTVACATCTTNASALTANLPVIGAGSQATAVGTRSGNTTAYVTTTGTQTSGRCVEIDASGNHIAAADVCGSGGGGGTAGSPLFVQTATATAVTSSTETTVLASGVGSLTIPTNWFTANGTVLDVRFSGKYSTGAVPGTLQLKLKFGATVVAQTVAFTPIVSVTDGLYTGFIRLVARTVGASGTIFVADGLLTTGSTITPGEIIVSNPTLGTAVTVDTTATQVVDLTATWGTAATNSITGYTFELVGPGSAVSSVNGQTGAVTIAAQPSVQNARLTLTSGVPITTADVTAATSVYVTPYNGNALTFYDGGTTWTHHAFTEQTITVPSTTATIYDVFCWYTGSAVECFADSTTDWASATSRGTGAGTPELVLQNGVPVNANSISGKCGATACTYYGSFRTTGVSGQTEDSGVSTYPNRRFVYNYWHQVRRPQRVIEATNSWTFSTDATFRQANANGNNQIEILCGYTGHCEVSLRVYGVSACTVANRGAATMIGEDSTTAALAGQIGGQINAYVINFIFPTHAHLEHHVPLGYHYYAWLEGFFGASGTMTWYGDNNSASGQLQTGMQGNIWN